MDGNELVENCMELVQHAVGIPGRTALSEHNIPTNTANTSAGEYTYPCHEVTSVGEA